MSETSSLKTLADYPVHTAEKLRYGDTDRQGHVNNAVFTTLFESGRVEILYDPACPLACDGTQFVIAKLSVNFLEELNWPGDVTIGTGVARLGRSSIGLLQGVFNGEHCVATAESVVVLIDEGTRQSTPLTETTRRALSALRLPCVEMPVPIAADRKDVRT